MAIGAQEEVVGHAVCSRGYVDGVPVGEPLVALVGNPAYYGRYGFRTATDHGITPPDPVWGDAFQVRTLTAYEPTLRGTFTFAEAFDLA